MKKLLVLSLMLGTMVFVVPSAEAKAVSSESVGTPQIIVQTFDVTEAAGTTGVLELSRQPVSGGSDLTAIVRPFAPLILQTVERER